MPYIIQERRKILDPFIDQYELLESYLDVGENYFENLLSELLDTYPKFDLTEGDINYIVSKTLANYIKKDLCYETFVGLKGWINSLILETMVYEETFSLAWDEFYRRVIAPYEDKAIERNGDVYDV